MSERDTAYHEAGHAVASCALRRGFHYASIEPDDAEGALGRVLGTDVPAMFESDIRCDLKMERLTHREIVIQLAGHAAQCHFCGQPEEPGGADQDYNSAFELADRICSSGEEAEALVKWLEVRAKMLIQNPRNADAIKLVAAALLEHKRLSATAVRKLFRQAYLPPARPPAAGHSEA